MSVEVKEVAKSDKLRKNTSKWLKKERNLEFWASPLEQFRCRDLEDLAGKVRRTFKRGKSGSV